MSRLLLRTSLAALFLGSAGHTAADQKPSAFIPGGVAHRAGKTGYVQVPAGGIDALDLASGKVLWSFKEPCRPLALVGDRLICHAAEKGKANAVRLVVLDAK